MIVWVWILGLLSAELHQLWLGLSILVVLSAFCLVRLSYASRAMTTVFLWSGIFVVAFLCVFLRQPTQLWHLPVTLIKKDVVIQGEIIGVPHHTAHADSVLVALQSFQGRQNASHIQLSWYSEHPPLRVGDVWRWTVRLKPPHGLSNPGGFHWQSWFLQHHIAATGYVVNSDHAHWISHHNDHWLTAYRQRGLGVIQHVIGQPHLAAIVAALTLGVREPLSQQQWTVFQRTGTSHLIAVSGLHIALIAMAIYQLSFWLWSRFPGLLLRLPAPYVATVCGLLSALCYAVSSGWGLPAQRACIMLACVLIGECTTYRFPLWRRLLLAFVLIITLSPMALLTASFWLSFVAVSWIGYALWGQQRSSSRRWQWLRIQGFLFVGLMPLNFYYFGQLSWLGCLANFFAIPWVSYLVLPLSFFAVIVYLFYAPLGIVLLHLAAISLSPLWWLLCHMAQWSHAVWHQTISGMMLCVLLLATLLLCSPRGVVGRGFAVLLLLPLLLPREYHPKSGNIWMTVLDVGQGLAVVVQTAHHLMLYDTGPHSYGGFDAGKDVVLPYLRYLHHPHVDLMMISHGDNDHIGGASAILEAVPVDKISSSIPAKLARWKPQHCFQGQQWSWDGVQFSVLWPPKGMPYQGNNSSCVLKISAHKKSILLTGDIEHMVEKQLTQGKMINLRSDVLLAPHHGSSTSSSAAFVDAVSPHIVVYSQGYYNRFGFPSPKVVMRYLQRAIEQYKTSLSGAIIVRLMDKGAVELGTFVNQDA